MPRRSSVPPRAWTHAVSRALVCRARKSSPSRAVEADHAVAGPIGLPRPRRAHRLALALAILTVLAGAFWLSLAYPASSAQDADDRWIATAMITPRNSHSLTDLADGRVLAAGGWDGGGILASRMGRVGA